MRLFSRTVLVALLLPFVVAAEPPGKENDKPVDPPANVDLFARVEARPEHLAALTLTAPFTPHAGVFTTTADLYGGTHPDLQLWSLRGVLSTKPGRINTGASLLVLTGFGPPAQTPLMELVMLQAGDDRDCWTLINTDEVRPFPPFCFDRGVIRDRTSMEIGGLPEYEAYWRILVQAHYTSAKAFAKAARHDVAYVHLFNETALYRGQAVHVVGRLIRLHRFEPMKKARAEGVSDLYEGWIMTDAFGENPVCIAFTDLPPGLIVDNERKYNEPVAFDGYLYKRYRYKAADTKKPNEFRDAPFLIGHSVILRSAGDGEETSEAWGLHLIWVFLSVVAAAVLGVIGLTCWFRYYDRRVRQRIRRIREATFVPPAEQEGEPGTNGHAAAGDQPPQEPTIESGRGTNWTDSPHSP